jgi:hypothetical protein
MFSIMSRSISLVAVMLLLGAVVAACTGDDDDVDADDLRPITATDTGAVELPADILLETVIVEDGSFDVQSIDVVAGQPVSITIANRDAETYTFAVEDLVQETEIAGAAETEVSFNAPNQGEYEATLYGPDGEEVASLFINVDGPGGF